jgi:hypothetical protein
VAVGDPIIHSRVNYSHRRRTWCGMTPSKASWWAAFTTGGFSGVNCVSCLRRVVELGDYAQDQLTEVLLDRGEFHTDYRLADGSPAEPVARGPWRDG